MPIGEPIYTALYLIAAGLLTFRLAGWTSRWIAFMLVSAGLNELAVTYSGERGYVLAAWIIMILILALVGVFEDPKKN